MVQIKCECNERHETEIKSIKIFHEIKTFFEEQTDAGIYSDIPVSKPLQILDNRQRSVIQWYPTKWYRCNSCKIIWAFNYPEFPAKGGVFKLDVDGKICLDSLFHKLY